MAGVAIFPTPASFYEHAVRFSASEAYEASRRARRQRCHNPRPRLESDLARRLFASCGTPGPQAKRKVHELTLELEDLGFTRNRDGREWIRSIQDDPTTKDVGELGSKETRCLANLIMQQEHGLQLNGGVGETEWLSEAVGQGLIELRCNHDDVDISCGAQLSFRTAAEQNQGEQVLGERVTSRGHEIVENCLNLLRKSRRGERARCDQDWFERLALPARGRLRRKARKST
jgi:hypothetical protein